MAVSDSTDFRSVANDIIKDARSLLGIDAAEEPLEAFELERGLRFLTRMLKAWEGDGIGGWTLTERSFALVQADVDYVLGTGGTLTTVPFEIMQVRITRGGSDLEMTPLSREEYYALPNKTTQGYPTQWYYDRQRDTGTLYVWPAPDATGGTIKFTERRRIMDVDAGANDYDLPPEWEEAIVWNLAERLIGPYGKAGSDEAKEVRRIAPVKYMAIKSWDVASGDGFISITGC